MSTLAIGGSRLRPMPLFKAGNPGSSPVNLTVPFTAYSTLVNHGVVSGGASQQFDMTQIVTSSSGGAGITVALTPTSMQLTVLAGTFLAGDVLTQQTGGNAGANALQVGASAVVGPFVVGEQMSSSSGGLGQIVEVNAGTIVLTGPGGAPAVQGAFNDGDTLTQTTGGAAGDTTVQTAPSAASGLLVGQTISITFDLSNYINGRVRGNASLDVAGTLGILYGNDKATMDLSFIVPQDTNQPNFQYPFDIIVLQPFCRIVFTNGAAPSTFFRAFVSALPV